MGTVPLRAIIQRTRQGVRYLEKRPAVEVPDQIARLLRPGTLQQLRLLSGADQRHLVGVAIRLHAEGAAEDVVIAGLLHDIGKVQGHRRVRLLDRTLKVVLNRVAPGVLRWLRATLVAPRGLGGLWLAVHHPRIGAEVAHRLGYSPRVSWLIAHHEDERPTDADLAALIAADDASSGT